MARSTATKLAQHLTGGFAGALALTLVHETARRLRPADAPRMDVLGVRGLRQLLGKADVPPPNTETLFSLTMAGDILSNTLYYSFIDTGRHAVAQGLLFGLGAGVGGVVLPGPLGLGTAPSGRTPQTKAMTVAWYTLGGLVAGLVGRAVRKAGKRRR